MCYILIFSFFLFIHNMQKLNEDITDRIIKIDDYKFKDIGSSNSNLSDIVVIYSDGNVNKIVHIDTLRKYPIIHDKFYDNDTDTIKDISLVFCPFTLYTSIYEGHLTLTNYKLYSIVVRNDTDFPIHMPPNNIWKIVLLLTHYGMLLLTILTVLYWSIINKI